MATTLALSRVPLSAFQVTVAACFSLSLVASASANAAVTWSLPRSARSMKPPPDEPAELDDPEPDEPPPLGAPPPADDEDEDPDEEEPADEEPEDELPSVP